MVFLVRRERIAGVCATPWKRGSIAEIKSQRIMEAIHEQPNDRAIDPRDHLAYAPKWARDPAMAERRNSARQRFASPPDEDNFFGSDTAEPFLVDEGETIGRGSRPSHASHLVRYRIGYRNPSRAVRGCWAV